MNHPLASIAVAFIIGIVLTRVLWEHIPPLTWLAIAILMLLTAFVTGSKQHHQKGFNLCKAYVQSITIQFCSLALGAYFSATEIQCQQEAAAIQTSQELTPLDRTILKAQHLQKDIADKYKQLGFSGQEYAIVTAMTLGDKSHIDRNTYEAYSQSGVNHILAISGMHMSIIFQAVILFLGGNWRSKTRLSLSLVAIWSYALITGLPTSVVRSSIMISIYVLIAMLHRKAISINSLALAAIVILAIHPMALTTISFQMSFLAVLSITLFLPIINNYEPASCKQNLIAKWIWQLAALSFCAQICIVPIIIYYFHQFALYSLLANFVAIPFATILIYGCLILFCLSPIPFLQEFCAQILNSITRTANFCFNYIAHLPNSYIGDIHINLFQLCCIYIAIGAIYLWIIIRYQNHHLTKVTQMVKKR